MHTQTIPKYDLHSAAGNSFLFHAANISHHDHVPHVGGVQFSTGNSIMWFVRLGVLQFNKANSAACAEA